MSLRKKLQRLRKSDVHAVYDEDLVGLLKKAGLLEKIKAGEVKCKYTGVTITLENLQAIIPTSSGYDFVSTDAFNEGKSSHG